MTCVLCGQPARICSWCSSDIGLRTHEILENTLQFQLTGHDDYGGGTTLATTLANIRAPANCCRSCIR